MTAGKQSQVTSSKAKKRWGYSLSGEQGGLTSEKQREIRRMFGSVDPTEADVIEEQINASVMDAQFEEGLSQPPTKAEVKAALLEFLRPLKRARNKLDELDERSQAHLSYALAHVPYEGDPLPEVREDEFGFPIDLDLVRQRVIIRRLQASIDSIDAAVDYLSESGMLTSKKAGRRSDRGLDLLIVGLALTYSEYVGPPHKDVTYDRHSKNYDGSFYLIVEATLKAGLPAKQVGNQALGSRIRRILRKPDWPKILGEL